MSKKIVDVSEYVSKGLNTTKIKNIDSALKLQELVKKKIKRDRDDLVETHGSVEESEGCPAYDSLKELQSLVEESES